MPEKVLIVHRFPKSQMARLGQRFELVDAAGKKLADAFSPEELGAFLDACQGRAAVPVTANFAPGTCPIVSGRSRLRSVRSAAVEVASDPFPGSAIESCATEWGRLTSTWTVP